MDKRVIFAVAGAGKTTYIVNRLNKQKRSLIVTYTNANYYNLQKKITDKFNGEWPENIELMKYFSFLYKFCYRPFLSDRVKAKGIIFQPNPRLKLKTSQPEFYKTSNGYLYSNRLAKLLIIMKTIDEIKNRLEKYFDEFVIDEVQDLAGRDFELLEHLMPVNMDTLFVGDYYQHTYDTSRDGNFNGKLFDNKSTYEKRFTNRGITCDNYTLTKSYRCTPQVCEYVKNNLGIEIESCREKSDNGYVQLIDEKSRVYQILNDKSIVKLHYDKSGNYGIGHRNWGDTKGEDKYNDICVVLNKKSSELMRSNNLQELTPSTRNKLYVAITRAKGNVFIIEDKMFKDWIDSYTI